MTIKLSEEDREGREGEIRKEKVRVIIAFSWGEGDASIDGTEQYSGLQTQASQTCLINCKGQNSE